MEYKMMDKKQLSEEYDKVKGLYEEIKARGLKLDMSRGKPCREQLDLSNGLFDALSPEDCADGFDIRNYGLLSGISECKALFAELMDVKPEQVFVGGNASLALMYGVLTVGYIYGFNGCTPWGKLPNYKAVCLVPGYDRHFNMAQALGAELTAVKLNDDGPDMAELKQVLSDPSVKLMFCVPKFSNPTGIVYSDEIIGQIAALKPAAEDFKIIWDNAYCIHELEGDYRPIPDILRLSEKNGNRDMVFEFSSTSKITLPGAGISAVAASEENIKYLSSKWAYQTISYDKINQLRHVKFLKNRDNIISLMKAHASIMKPKFDAFISAFEHELEGTGIAKWTKPKGGYFISFDVMPGLAKRTVELMKSAGIILTGAGATYPYGTDPEDKNIRIAPSYPPLDEAETAAAALTVCTKLAYLEKAVL